MALSSYCQLGRAADDQGSAQWEKQNDLVLVRFSFERKNNRFGSAHVKYIFFFCDFEDLVTWISLELIENYIRIMQAAINNLRQEISKLQNYAPNGRIWWDKSN